MNMCDLPLKWTLHTVAYPDTEATTDQFPLPQSLLPGYGMDWYWQKYECSGLGMESRQWPDGSNHDGHERCPEQSIENDTLQLQIVSTSL